MNDEDEILKTLNHVERDRERERERVFCERIIMGGSSVKMERTRETL